MPSCHGSYKLFLIPPVNYVLTVSRRCSFADPFCYWCFVLYFPCLFFQPCDQPTSWHYWLWFFLYLCHFPIWCPGSAVIVWFHRLSLNWQRQFRLMPRQSDHPLSFAVWISINCGIKKLNYVYANDKAYIYALFQSITKLSRGKSSVIDFETLTSKYKNQTYITFTLKNSLQTMIFGICANSLRWFRNI